MILAKGGAVVEHRVDEHLSTKSESLVIAALRDGRGEAAPSAHSAHSDPGGVDAELVRALVHPPQCCHAVVKCGRERVFRRQPVVG
jgi:hypothetical protein